MYKDIHEIISPDSSISEILPQRLFLKWNVFNLVMAAKYILK